MTTLLMTALFLSTCLALAALIVSDDGPDGFMGT